MRWRSAIVLTELNSASQLSWGALNAKNMDISENPLDDDRHMQNAVKRARTSWRKIVWKKLDVQTADKILWLTQDVTLFTKKKKK